MGENKPVLYFSRIEIGRLRRGCFTVLRQQQEPDFAIGDTVVVAHGTYRLYGKVAGEVRIVGIRHELRPGVWREGIGVDVKQFRADFDREGRLAGHDNWLDYMRIYRGGNTDAQLQPCWRVEFEILSLYVPRRGRGRGA